MSDAPELRAQSNIEVDGLGLLGDRRMDQRLSFLLGTDNKTAVELDSAFLEDSAFLLLEQMRRGGYLRPSVKAIFSGASAQVEAEWGTPYAVQLPVEFRADSAIFRLQRGPLFFYKSVEVSGLEEIEIGTLKRFFVPGGSLIKRKKDLAYTPENFERRKNRLLAALKALGYAEAEVFSEEVDMDETTGAVRVRLEVKAGPVYRVGPVTLKVIEGEAEWFQPIHFAEGGIFNPEWLREARATLRNAAYGAGRPDVEVSSHLGEPLPDAEGMLQPAVFKLRPGPEIYLEGLRFEGDPETKESVLRRQADLEAGALLDPRETDRARRRLMALGIFRQVELDYDTQSYGSRVAVYRLTPGTRQELQLLAGWGSYEQARVGFLWTHHNPWGRAHRYTLSAKQSVKATRLATNYQIEQLFGSDLTGYSEAEFGSRKEIGYERSRQGGLVGVSKLLGETGIRLALEYGWFIEQTDGIDETAVAGDEDAQVASLTLTASLDRRDSVLAPTSGYTLFAAIKTANQALGGSVDFQKFEIGGSYHFSVSESTLLHLGLKGGVLIGSSNELPFNERFFPGGENSVRGFQQGEATALDIDGDPIGAESFWVANLEVEQRLLSDVSVVAFFDAVGFHRENGQGGESETLATAGLGLRYQTIVGPLRLEYGHNINPREQDPSGTLHFSIGFPF
ncbi:MAG: BamA/OMP85 family outer membrane protein [Opitutales bacterium]